MDLRRFPKLSSISEVYFEVVFTRLNEHYRPAVELACLILRSTSFEIGRGAVAARSFLIDMNALFEDFVIIALRETLGLREYEFPQGAKGRSLNLDSDRKVHLEPDLSRGG